MTYKAVVEERWNSYTHAFGFVLALIGSLVLFQNVSTVLEKKVIAVYCFGVSLLFLASTVYHMAKNAEVKKKFRVLDHISIYFLIAGTYTPVCLLRLQDSKGWLLFYSVWGITLLGILLKLFFTGKFEKFSLALYGVMGWLVVIDLPHLTEALSSKELFLLTLGGTFYTLGMLFYAIKKIPFNHLIWHFFVLGGAISHWFMVYEILL